MKFVSVKSSYFLPPLLLLPSPDPLLWPVVPREDPGSVAALGGAGKAPQEAAGQVWQRAAALLRRHVLRAQRVTTGARGHQVGPVFHFLSLPSCQQTKLLTLG